MACRYPDADTPEALWETVLARRRAFRRLPEERLRLADYAPRGADDPDAIYPIEAALLENYAFDRGRHRVPAAAFASADLTHWLALDVAGEALADAGLPGGGERRKRTTVIVGNTLTGEFSRAGMLRLRWPYVRRRVEAALVAEGFDPARRAAFVDRLEEAYKEPFPPPDEESLAGALSNTIAGRICNHYDLHGGGFTVDGACASSLLAVASGCLRLIAGEADVVLAGGVDLSLDPFELVGFARNGALSRSAMRVFDARSDGFWPGEGCGFVVLMRAADARDGGHQARAEIRGWGMSTDGRGGLTRPTVAGQRAALERAYRLAGFDAGTVPLFEAHGTGTAVGDPVEIAAIAAVRRAAGAGFPAAVGSIKANIGHTKAAAGVAGLIKTVIALDRQIVPAATACEEPHPAVLEHRDMVAVPPESRLWPVDQPLRAGVSAMGFGGINLHLALEGTASSRRTALDPPERRLLAGGHDAELFVFSADTRSALRAQVESLAAVAPSLSGAELGDAAAALARRMEPGAERAMAVAASPGQLAERLRLLARHLDSITGPSIDAEAGIAYAQAGAPRIVFLFPGQAAPAALGGGWWRRRFAEIDALYAEAGLVADGDETATEIAQPAIVTASLAGLLMLDKLGIAGSAAVGHSLGELTALHWAGGWDLAAVLRLARGRGRIMADRALPGGAMALLAGSPQAVGSLLGGDDAGIACYNAPGECVVSGAEPAIIGILARAERAGIPARRLAVSHAFHSRFVAPAAPAVAGLVGAEPCAPLRRAVFSTVTGARLDPDADLAALLSAQIVAPVRFADALAAAAPEADLLIEVGPGHGLARVAGGFAQPPAIALDAGGKSAVGLLLAAGAAFVLGAPVRVGVLFDGRFVRPFDLDRPRRFLANPCEQAPALADPQTRKPPVRVRLVPSEATSARQTPLELVRALVAERLELAPDRVEPGHRLLGDLHLNSIAVGQLVAEAARSLGLSPPAAPTNFAMATVGEVAEALRLGALLQAEDTSSAPAGVDGWLRVFAPELVERPIRRSGEVSPRTWRIFAPPGHPLADRLAGDAEGDADGVAICLPEGPGPEHLSLLLDGAWAGLAGAASACVLIVQQGGGGAAFARCLSLEHPRLRVRVVDLPFDHPQAAAWLAAETAGAEPGYAEAHYDSSGVRRVPILRVLPAPQPAPFLGADDVVLISGGAKGIGCECVLALARRTGARVAMLGRSPADMPEVRASLARLEAAGIRAAYRRADVTDRAAVGIAVAGLQAELGTVTAVIHAAGINRPASMMQLDLATFRDTVAVKLDGARNLVAALDPERLRLLVGFGSIIARTGLPGEAHYALANEWLGHFVEEFAGQHQSCRCHVLEWSAWSGVGMAENLGAVEKLSQLGVAALAVDEATAMFEALVSQPPIRPAAVVAGRFGDPPTVDLIRPELPALRFLERVPVFYPDIELVAEADLADLTDPYLAEHALGGTPLFPAVLGLEAMAQAAAALAGGRRPRLLEGVEFRQPVAPGPGGCRLRVAALARAADRIETVLRCETTGFQADHFRAVARFEDRAGSPPSALPDTGPLLALDPAELYGRLLFHTGRFRRIGGYSRLAAGGCVARIEPAGTQSWFPAREADDLVLGDPGARDAALHALQACIPHRRVLPVAVERIELGHLVPDRAYWVHGRETRRDRDRFTFDVEIRDENGTLAERWGGLALQAIDVLPLPDSWPVPLAAPFLERRLGDLLPGLDLRIGIADGGGSGTAPSTAAVISLALGDGRPVLRRPDGKPEAEDYVSASHCGALTIAAAAEVPVGCDVEAVEERTEMVWGDLLGTERFALARLAARMGAESLDRAATRVWGAVEALAKAGAAVGPAPLTWDRVDDGWVIFAAGAYTVASRIEAFECAGRRPFAIAVAVRQPSLAAVNPLAGAQQPRAAPVGRSDPRPSYSYRHVVGFGDTNLVGNVYFVNHLEWQGRCREMFLRDKTPSLLDDLAQGLALVTTKCSCEYVAELTAFDEVRVDMRLNSLTVDRIALGFEYWRCRDGGEDLAALGEQEIACMRLVGGKKVAVAIPEALVEALRPYGPAVPGRAIHNA
jgi:enediyne polyketide synthase